MKIIKIVLLVFTITICVNSLLQDCPASYFFDVQHCEKCQDNCICFSEMTCHSCIDGYTFYKSQCIQCPQADGIYG